MSTRIELQPGYILHTRPYRDTSLLVDALTQEFGKVSFVARGARKTTKSNSHSRYLLQPFIPLLLSWQGKSSLKTLVGVEASALAHSLSHHKLYSAMYVNELLSYLLPQDDVVESIYHHYCHLLQALEQEESNLEACLRGFEFMLLEELGYGVNFSENADDGSVFNTDEEYFFIQNHGFVLSNQHPEIRDIRFSGADLHNLQQGELDQVSTLKAAKLISRIALKPHLRGRKINSRDLFQSLKV